MELVMGCSELIHDVMAVNDRSMLKEIVTR